MIKINIISNNNQDANYKFLKIPNNYIEKKINNLNKNFKKYKKKNIYFTLLLSGDKEIKKIEQKI